VGDVGWAVGVAVGLGIGIAVGAGCVVSTESMVIINNALKAIQRGFEILFRCEVCSAFRKILPSNFFSLPEF
jgi:hypothetical protein